MSMFTTKRSTYNILFHAGKYAVALLLFLFITPSVLAQRIIGELESNSDGNLMNEGDTTAQGNKDKKKIVPVDIRAWRIDGKYGNMTPTYVDTLHHQYQNNNLTEGMNGHFNHLGNLGSPRLSRIYMEREDWNKFVFLNPFDMFFVETDQFKFYNTKSPFMNLAYNFCGSKTTGDDHFKATFTNNVNKRVNFGAIYDYMYGQGYYANQSTAYMNASAFASYIGDRYDFHFYYMHNHMKLAENGGIEDEMYITRPEELPQSYGSSDIPTMLERTWSKQEHDVVFFNHHYNIGFMREEGDSTDIKEVFVPVTSFFHTFKLQKFNRSYLAYETPEYFHSYTYLPGDSANDKTTNLNIKNLFGVSLHEGFNKWAAAGVKAYIGFEHNSYTLPDTIQGSYGFNELTRTQKTTYKENSVLVGGQIIREQGKTLHYNVDAEFIIAGDYMGNFDIRGYGELNIPMFKDTVQLAVNAFIKNQNPGFYFNTYHSKHAWWNKESDNVVRTRVEGTLTIPKSRTRLTFGVENIKNYAYFMNNGTAYTDNEVTKYSNNITPMQCGENIQVMSVNLKQNFKFGIFNLENDVTFQKCTNKDVLPLPTISTYHNFYIDFKIAKVLACEFGTDLKYFTEYYAPDYSPVFSNFYTQNPNKKLKIGNYPLISVYANFDLKRTRFYVQYYHANQGTGRYFWAPGYPMNPAGLHMGLSWNFYD